MKLPYPQFLLLRGIERAFRRTDPHTVAMLALFARLYAGEAIASHEQARSPASRVWHLVARLASVLVSLAAGLAAASRRPFRRPLHAVIRRLSHSSFAKRALCTNGRWP